MNKMLVNGNIVADCQVRDTKNPDYKMITFSLVNNEVEQGVEQTTYFNCMFIKQNSFVDFAKKYLVKGTRLFLNGRMKSWSNGEKTTYTIRVDEFEILKFSNKMGNNDIEIPKEPKNENEEKITKLNSDDIDLPF